MFSLEAFLKGDLVAAIGLHAADTRPYLPYVGMRQP